jgi:hypothetical protein
MLVAGDEIGRTQQGNNNAYCQDNELSWVDWALDDSRKSLLDFTQCLTRLRREHLVFRQRHFFDGRPLFDGGPKDIAWFAADGTESVDWWERRSADARDVPVRPGRGQLVPLRGACRAGSARLHAARCALCAAYEVEIDTARPGMTGHRHDAGRRDQPRRALLRAAPGRRRRSLSPPSRSLEEPGAVRRPVERVFVVSQRPSALFHVIKSASNHTTHVSSSASKETACKAWLSIASLVAYATGRG